MAKSRNPTYEDHIKVGPFKWQNTPDFDELIEKFGLNKEK